MTSLKRVGLWTGVGLVLLVGSASGAEPSRDLSAYVLFGNDGIRARSLHIVQGDVGVNHGSLAAHDAIDGPSSTVAGYVVSVGGGSRCAQLFFASALGHTAPACGPGTPFQEPLIADLASACGFPDEFPDCTGGPSVDDPAGTERTLPPGVYGDVDVGGAATRHGRLVLTGGRYVFCSLPTRRGSIVEADSASQLFVAGNVTIGSKSHVDPAP